MQVSASPKKIQGGFGLRTLVTGSEGFVASHLDLDGEVLGLDETSGHDILEPDTADIIREFDPEVVYHLAAHHYIPWCDEHPMSVNLLNIQGTGMVLGSCGPSLKAFVLASSAAVYGFGSSPRKEDSPLAGTGPYAHSKIAAERLLAGYALLHPGVRYIAARLFNVAGTGDRWPHVLPTIIEAHRSGAHIVLGNTWPMRDYIHADDVAAALTYLTHAAPTGFSAYNVGTGRGVTVAELVAAVGKVAGRRVSAETREANRRPSDGHLVADISKLTKLGWTASRTLEEAIGDLLGADAQTVGG